MRVAVIDNIDSFVYNLVQYVGELGAEPIVVRNDAAIREVEDARADRILVSPGPRTPKDAGISVQVIAELGRKTPTLGVCLGHQAVAYAFGGEIVSAKRLVHGKNSKVRHTGEELFRGLPNPFEATRYHSLVVRRSNLPQCLSVIAETADSDREIMAIQHNEFPIWGVQFHPESILTVHGKRLISNFLKKETS